MALVDIDRAAELDKIHIKRMFHAFAKVFLGLIALEDARVNSVLNAYSIVLMPGPHAGIEYASYSKQILEAELKAEKLRLAKAEKEAAKKPKGKKKR